MIRRCPLLRPLRIFRADRAWWTAGLLCFAPLCAQGQAIRWQQPQLLEAGTGSPRGPLIAMAGEQVVAVWGRSATQRIEAAVSTNGGASWQTPQVLDSGVGNASTPQFSLAGSRAVAVWVQEEGKSSYIAGTCSTNGGTTWLPAQRLSSGAGRVRDARVALAGSQAVVAWVREEDGGSTFVTAQSTDGGITWDAAQVVSTANGKVADPSLAIAGTRAVAIWGQDTGAGMHLFSSNSADGGQHWGTPQRIEHGLGKVYAGSSWAYCPQVTLAGNNAIAIWCQDSLGGRNIFITHSADGGATWGAAESCGGTYFPHVALVDSTAVAVWVSGAVLTRCSTDGGATWQSVQAISAGWPPADNPAVAISGSRVVVVWRQHDGTQLSTFANVSLDGGKSWQTPQQLDTNATMGWYPQVAIDGERVAALWMQMTVEWNWSLFVTYSTVGGQHWHAPRVVATGAGDAGEPCVALADTRAIMLWSTLEQSRWVLRAAYSTDRGDSWHPAPWTAPDTGPVNSAAAALIGSHAVTVWQQLTGPTTQRIAAARSTDGGATWQGAEHPIVAADGTELTTPAVALADAAAVAVWRRRTPDTSVIDAACSENGGQSWAKPQTISTGPTAAEPQVAIAGSQVVATWLARTGTEFTTWAAHSANSGKHWEKAQLLQSGSRGAGGPRVAIAGRQAVVVWQQDDGAANRIYASCSPDSGRTWGPARPVEIGFGDAWGPAVSFVGSRILVVWRQREERALPLTEYSHQSRQNTQYGCYSTDGGQTWSAPQILATGFGESVTPVVAWDGSQVLAGSLSHQGGTWTLSANLGAVTFPDPERRP